jgi:dipeptidyl aminopeptidase/acylaminoacyl peptidase
VDERRVEPTGASLAGYALLLSPTMPIIGEPGSVNDEYVPQLVANAEAAVSFLVEKGIADPERIAIGGRSYGAFSAANLLVYTRLFRSGIAMSGAYNRTLTPFGFQHERRSFWKETALYAEISPFFHADQIEAPLLLVHGGEDPNAGTPREQARRFFHALVGNGAPVRYVELPHEGHHYAARESVFHAASELLDWLEGTLGPSPAASSGPVTPDGRNPRD